MGQSINSEQRQLMFKLEREVEIGLSLCKKYLEDYDWDYDLTLKKINEQRINKLLYDD